MQKQQHVATRGARPAVELRPAPASGFQQSEGRYRPYPFAGAVVAAAVNHNDLSGVGDGSRFNDGGKAHALIECRNDDRKLHDG